MTYPRIYADFHSLDDHNRLKLTCAGTRADLDRLGLELHEGMLLTFYMDDADDHGRPDDLRVDGAVRFSSELDCWVAEVDWSAIRHASQDSAAERNGEAACQRQILPVKQ